MTAGNNNKVKSKWCVPTGSPLHLAIGTIAQHNHVGTNFDAFVKTAIPFHHFINNKPFFLLSDLGMYLLFLAGLRSKGR